MERKNHLFAPTDYLNLHSPPGAFLNDYQPLLAPLPTSKYTLSRAIGIRRSETPHEEKKTVEKKKQQPVKIENKEFEKYEHDVADYGKSVDDLEKECERIERKYGFA